jgi:predicted phosphodiesterase
MTLIIPDLHAPLHNPASLGAILALMSKHTFDEVILLGDACEFVSCSWFGGPEALRSYKQEAHEAAQALMQIRNLHSGPITLTIGNHDGRPDAKVEKIAPQLHGSIVEEVGFAAMGITLVPENEQPITRGRIRFIHGHQDSGKFPSVYHARRMADLYGLPGVAVVYGHTHSSQTFTRKMHGGVSTAYGLGCLELRPTWQRGVSGWTQEFAIAYPNEGVVQPIRIENGTFWWGGNQFSNGTP